MRVNFFRNHGCDDRDGACPVFRLGIGLALGVSLPSAISAMSDSSALSAGELLSNAKSVAFSLTLCVRFQVLSLATLACGSLVNPEA